MRPDGDGYDRHANLAADQRGHGRSLIRRTGEGVDTTEEEPTSASRERTMHALLGVPFTHGNDVKMLRNGDQVFPALLDAIGSATHDRHGLVPVG